MLSLQAVSDYLHVPIYVKRVSILNYFKTASLLISVALYRERILIHDNNKADPGSVTIIGTILDTMGWFTPLKKNVDWTPYQWLLQHPDTLVHLRTKTLNELIGFKHRSIRSRALLDTTQLPVDHQATKPNLEMYERYLQSNAPNSSIQIRVCDGMHSMTKMTYMNLSTQRSNLTRR